MADAIHKVSDRACPGCAIPHNQRVFYPEPTATLHVDGDGTLFVMQKDTVTRVPVELVPYEPHDGRQAALPLDPSPVERPRGSFRGEPAE